MKNGHSLFRREFDDTHSCFKCANSFTQKSTGVFPRKILAPTHNCVQEIFLSIVFNVSLLQEKFILMSVYIICHAYVSMYFYKMEVYLLSQKYIHLNFYINGLIAHQNKTTVLMCFPTKSVCGSLFSCQR